MIDVKTASLDDLMAEAVEVLGLEVTSVMPLDTIRRMVDEAQNKTVGSVPSDESLPDSEVEAVDDTPSEAELVRGQAKDLGIKGWHNTGIDKLKVKIAAQLEQPEVVDPERLREAKAKEDRKPENRVKVIFHNTDGPDGDHIIKVSVNGYRTRIRREEEIWIPKSVLNVINDAVITSFYRDDITGEIKERSQRRFNYSVVG